MFVNVCAIKAVDCFIKNFSGARILVGVSSKLRDIFFDRSMADNKDALLGAELVQARFQVSDSLDGYFAGFELGPIVFEAHHERVNFMRGGAVRHAERECCKTHLLVKRFRIGRSFAVIPFVGSMITGGTATGDVLAEDPVVVRNIDGDGGGECSCGFFPAESRDWL